jgi:hypothetical protein
MDLLLQIVTIASCLAAWVAIIFSYKTLGIARQQEARCKPSLILSIFESYLNKTKKERVYAFMISVSNSSDTDNAIVQTDLRIEYRTDANYLAVVVLPASRQDEKPFINDSSSSIQLPISVDAHHNATGWIYFHVSEDLIENWIVDSYKIVVTDSHGEKTSIEPTLIKELIHET